MENKTPLNKLKWLIQMLKFTVSDMLTIGQRYDVINEQKNIIKLLIILD